MTLPEYAIWQILLYLQAHPEAKDTVDGIRTWWISQSEDLPNEALVEAIDELVRKGWLHEREGLSSPKVYGLNPHARPAIEMFLRARTLQFQERITPPTQD
ncbi:MAG: hypothetical protein D6690_16765 [Nitrospirae bacterium]|nr:MAG: hypothetical protein D6690_16765 [Nitrospirota bacterium]